MKFRRYFTYWGQNKLNENDRDEEHWEVCILQPVGPKRSALATCLLTCITTCTNKLTVRSVSLAPRNNAKANVYIMEPGDNLIVALVCYGFGSTIMSHPR